MQLSQYLQYDRRPNFAETCAYWRAHIKFVSKSAILAMLWIQYSITLSLLPPHFFNIHLIFSSHLQLCFLRDTSHSRCPATITYERLFTPVLSTCSKYLTFIDFNISMPGIKITLFIMLLSAAYSDVFPLRYKHTPSPEPALSPLKQSVFFPLLKDQIFYPLETRVKIMCVFQTHEGREGRQKFLFLSVQCWPSPQYSGSFSSTGVMRWI